MAPLDDPLPHDEALRIGRSLVSQLASRFPNHYILSSQARREGRIFLDYLRNGRGTTAIGTWSPRARVGFPIAQAVTWAKVERGIRPDAFTMRSSFRPRECYTTAIQIRNNSARRSFF
jgi:bifunctional non-homologous end joining protein LigD